MKPEEPISNTALVPLRAEVRELRNRVARLESKLGDQTLLREEVWPAVEYVDGQKQGAILMLDIGVAFVIGFALYTSCGS